MAETYEDPQVFLVYKHALSSGFHILPWSGIGIFHHGRCEVRVIPKQVFQDVVIVLQHIYI